MTRRLLTPRSLLAAALCGSVVLSGCGVAAKQADEKRIVAAADRTFASHQVVGTLYVTSLPIKPHRPVPPGPGRIAYIATGALPVVIDPARQTAAVEDGGTSPRTQIVFTPHWMYERRPANPSASASALLASSGAAVTNLALLKAAPVALPTSTPAAGGSAAAGSAPTGYQAVSTQSRPWVALDYSGISSRDRTKTPGSLAINPALLLRLADGVLTGSVLPLAQDHSNKPADQGLRQLLKLSRSSYKVNFSLDKAEKGLADKDKQVIARVLTANAVFGSVFPGAVWLKPDGTIGGLLIALPQLIDSDNQAVLFIALILGSSPSVSSPIPVPRSSQTVTVANLGDLVHQVAQ